MITQAELRARFSYYPQTGELIRRTRSNRAVRAGTRNSCGYIRIIIEGKAYLAHRLVWLYVYGEFPRADIDHINGDRADNRIANLRDVPRAVNSGNRHTANRNSSHGVLGVTRASNRWMAQISTHGRKQYLGIFDTAEAAQAAYNSAKQAKEANFANHRQ